MTSWVVIPLLTLVALERVSVAASPVPVPLPLHIDFTAPRGCSHVGAFYAGVLARTNRVRRAKPGEKGPRFRVRLTRTGTKVRGELTVMADRGDSNTRRVDGDSCNEVVEVLSLTVALALDPAAGSPPGVALTPSPLPPSSSGSSSSAPSSPSFAPSPLAPASSPSAPSSPASSPVAITPPPAPLPPPEPPKAPVAVSPVVAPPPPVDTAPPTDAPGVTVRPEDDGPARTYSVDLGARAVVANVLSPYVSLGGALSLLVIGKRDESVPPSLGLALMHVPNNFLRPAPDVLVRWTALVVTACPPLGLHGALQVQPCAMGVGGWLAATERAVSSPLSVGRTWWSAGALLRTTLPLGHGFSINLDLGVSVPIVKRRFTVTSSDTTVSTVGETPAMSGLAGIGVSHSL